MVRGHFRWGGEESEQRARKRVKGNRRQMNGEHKGRGETESNWAGRDGKAWGYRLVKGEGQRAHAKEMIKRM